jgi:hypothetical protein
MKAMVITFLAAIALLTGATILLSLPWSPAIYSWPQRWAGGVVLLAAGITFFWTQRRKA